ncbi:MAG TPA: flavodoxin domain-containing protein [Anaerolineae bacterium]|nr:flavodoxin domain-containing protein [Anaerolineae bacterium]HQI85099.1 flavodoxin domain-containing protein [Anaerolineae bacterium]
MKTLVVYDSVFGNTEKIAQAMGAALGCEVRRITEVTPEQLTGLDALIVGSPTQAFQALKPVKAFLKSIPAGSLKGVKVAAFDTRMDVKAVNNAVLTVFAKAFGYAAEPIGKQLVKKGGTQAVSPEGFIVTGEKGPLREGELERAVAWAQKIR